MPALFLGLISGTSADGVDAALLHFEPEFRVLAAATRRYPDDLRARLLSLTAEGAAIPLDEFGSLDVAVGECFAAAALDVLAAAGVAPDEVTAIGSHGQTVRHRPGGRFPFSLQIGDASVIAERTGICTVADFRRADIAAGGQGAPLAPAFHAAAFAAHAPCAILNLGGIANLSLLGADGALLGFDTGPANCLLDAWNERHNGSPCDLAGAWAVGGKADPDLLAALLDDAYYALPPPKSSGREHFNLDWLESRLPTRAIAAVDVQATLLALSARTIADALGRFGAGVRKVLACGGGVRNDALMASLAAAIAPIPLASTASAGVDPDFVEAALFAWLARERLAGRSGNRPSVSGARGPRLLGAVHAAPR